MRTDRTVSVFDAVAIVIGIVLGAGIFKTPSLVASSLNNEWLSLTAWLTGGAVSLAGALCYAELAGAYPDTGGEYHYLTRAFGKTPAFFFAWARMTVVQAGSIAMLAFLVGDYLAGIWDAGKHSAAAYAAAVVTGLTGLNMSGIRMGSGVQKTFIACLAAGLAFIIGVGLAGGAAPAPPPPSNGTSVDAFGRAMVFVLLTYGGWNEASYLSSDLKDSPGGMLKVLTLSIALITAVYLAVNLTFFRTLGVEGVAASGTVAADMMRQALGEWGAAFISMLIALAALSTMNGTILTGARTNCALGRDFPLFACMGKEDRRRGTPANAMAVQWAVSLGLIALGAGTRNGFAVMVEYTAPVFWLFFLLTGLSVFVLRRKDPDAVRPFRTPWYPFLPLFFCAASAFMLLSSLAYTGKGAMVGMLVLCAGIPVLLIGKTGRLNENGRNNP